MAAATLTLHDPQTEREEDAPSRPPRRARRWPRVVAALVVLLGAAVWFAPAILARSGLRHRLVHVVAPAYPGRASVGAASLNWLGPVVLRDLILSDPDGGELLRIGELRTSLPLVRLLAAGDDLGTVTIVRPEAVVRLRPGGSNLEDTLQPLLEGAGPASGLTVLVEEGRVRWTGIDGQPAKGGIEGLSAKVVRAAGSPAVRGEVKGRLGNGEVAGEFSVEVAPAETDADALGITAAATGLPAGAVQAWLDRFGVGANVEGFVSADLVGTLAPAEGGSWSVEGKVQAQRLWVTVPELADDEPIKIESVALGGKVSRVANRLALEKVELRSELGTATADGRLDLAALSAGGLTEQIGAALAQEGGVTASADLARVAAAFGRALKLKQPVESGRLDVELRVSPGEGDRRIGVLRVGVKDLVAGRAEQRLAWREPLTVDLAVRRDAAGTVVERLRAESDGVTLVGSGSLAGAEVRFEADLDRVRTQLARLVELPEGALSGRAEGRVVAKRTGAAADLVHVEAVAGVKSLALVLPGRRWSERDLSLRASADLRLTGLKAAGIDSGGLGLRSVEGDELTAKLTAPVSISDGSAWPLEAAVKGDLRRWSDRAAAWSVSPLPAGWSIDGTIDAGGSLRVAGGAVEVVKSSGEVRGFRLRTSDRTLDEPYVRIAGSGRWDAGSGLLTLSSATLASETASGQATDVRLPLAGGGAASGRVSFRGGAGRIGRYFLPPRPPVWLSGVVGGTVELSSDAAATVAGARLEFERPVLTRPAVAGPQVEWRPVWSDERLTAEFRARYHHVGDALELKSATVTATGLAVEATGRIGRVTTVAEAELSGSIDCDLGPLSERLASGLPGGVVAKGRSKRPFAVRGPLLGVGGVDPALAASAALGWEQVDAFGLTLGPGELSGRLAGRTVTIGSFDWAVAGGHVRAAPVVSLDGPATLRLPKGRVAEDVHLTPELCRTWLRYAAPVLADATQVQGTASLDVAEAGVPVLDPAQARADGVLVLQGAEASPGPLARSILDAVRQVQAIAGHDPTSGSDLRLVAPPQSVAVRVAGGRVAHDRFLVRIGDENGPAVATAGSVGFDETLDLVADVPLDARWFKNERVAAALGGQALRVPIRGTLARPALDPRAFQDLARRAAAGAINGAIERQLGKQVSDPLRKLLDRGK